MWPKDNPESWKQIHEFIGEFPDDEYWSRWKPMVSGVVAELESRGMTDLFRVGQSMHEIIFSTLDHHQLTDEPRVTLEFHPKEQNVRIMFSRTNSCFGDRLIQETAPENAAMPVILRYLRRLWSETKPEASMPEALNVL